MAIIILYFRTKYYKICANGSGQMHPHRLLSGLRKWHWGTKNPNADLRSSNLTLDYSTQKVGCVGVCWGVLQQKHIPPGNLWGVAGTPQWYTPESGV